MPVASGTLELEHDRRLRIGRLGDELLMNTASVALAGRLLVVNRFIIDFN